MSNDEVMGSPEHQNRLSKGVTGKVVIPEELARGFGLRASESASRPLGWFAVLDCSTVTFSAGNEKATRVGWLWRFCSLFLE